MEDAIIKKLLNNYSVHILKGPSGGVVQGPCFVSEELITSGEMRSLASLKPQFEFKSLKFTLSVLENNDLYNTQEFQRQLQKFKVFHNVSLPFSMWFSRLWQRSKNILKLMLFTFRIKQDKQLNSVPVCTSHSIFKPATRNSGLFIREYS